MSFGTTINKKKNGVLLAYLAERIPGINLRKLLKLVYLIDEASVLKRGLPLTWFDYFAWKKGPVAPEVYEVKNGSFSDYVECFKNDHEKWEVHPIPSFIDKSELDLYSQNEIDIINDVISRYGAKSADELTDMTHVQGSLWDKVVSENSLDFSVNGKSSCEICLKCLIKGDEEKMEIYEEAEEYMQFCNVTSRC